MLESNLTVYMLKIKRKLILDISRYRVYLGLFQQTLHAFTPTGRIKFAIVFVEWYLQQWTFVYMYVEGFEILSNFPQITRVTKYIPIPAKMFTQDHRKGIITAVAALRSPKAVKRNFCVEYRIFGRRKDNHRPNHFKRYSTPSKNMDGK